LAGDTGKSLVSLGLIRAFSRNGLSVAPFKKGPDFIDAAWLGAAAGTPGRNLDTYLMEAEVIRQSMGSVAETSEIAVVEGNRGLYDGMDAAGSHSTAELAKLTGTPVILVINVTKSTRTVAALVKGCQSMDPDLEISGVVLNNVGTKRQEKVIRQAVARETGVAILGAIPRLDEQHLPSRHLGLVTAMEHPDVERALERVADAVAEHVDLDAVLAVGRNAPEIAVPQKNSPDAAVTGVARVGVLEDEAFSFYYPENLAALEKEGAEIVPISPLNDRELPEVDALYAGGGFPEVHAAELSANETLRESLKNRVAAGLPVWAECGGLMYLSEGLIQDGATFPMVGALPVAVEQMKKPQGHGYVRGTVEGENPFLAGGTSFRGHEFHYSRLVDADSDIATVLKLDRGPGVGGGRDGIQVGSVVATYTHLHALGTPEWAGGLVNAGAGGPRP
jgi:cobyrinic acid a,c-diamide synthase